MPPCTRGAPVALTQPSAPAGKPERASQLHLLVGRPASPQGLAAELSLHLCTPQNTYFSTMKTVYTVGHSLSSVALAVAMAILLSFRWVIFSSCSAASLAP